QSIEAEPRDDRSEKCIRRSQVMTIRGGVAQPRILHHVLGFAGAAQHAVRDGKQPRPPLFERGNRRRAHAAAANTCANPSRMVGYCGRQPRSAAAFSLESAIRISNSLDRYGMVSRGSQAGTAIGCGAPIAKASVRTMSLKLTE